MTDIQAMIPEDAKQLSTDAETTLELVKGYKITSQEEYAWGADQLKTIKTKAKNLEARRKEITKPMDAAKKSVMDFFRPPAELLANSEALVKSAMLTYQQEENKRQREIQRKAEEAAEKERKRLAKLEAKAIDRGDEEKAQHHAQRAQNVQAPIVRQETPKASGISTRKIWKSEVTDLMELVKAVAAGDAPIALLQANGPEINKRVKALRDEFSAPGVRVYSEDSMSARAA